MKALAVILTVLVGIILLYTLFVDDSIMRYIQDDLIPSFVDFLKAINIGYF